MIIQSDTRQKKGHHKAKEKWFAQNGIRVVPGAMLVGDYQIPSKGNISVDTKANISELYGNLIQQHDRFHNECVLAQDLGVKLYILIENKDGVKCVEDLKDWKNPQMLRYYRMRKMAQAKGVKEPKPPASNVQLIKIMHSMTRDYGVQFMFCTPNEAGKRVIELLTGEEQKE